MNRLRAMRKERGLTLMGLAASAGTSPAMIVYVEKYGHLPGPDLQQRIAHALGVQPADLWPESHQSDARSEGAVPRQLP